MTDTPNPATLPTRLTLEPDGHSVTDQDGRLILHRQHGFDGADLPTIAELVRDYNAHPAAVALARALNAWLKTRHLGLLGVDEMTVLLNVAQEWEKAAKL